ncbi:trehalose-6-phosphate synthase [Rhizobium grahamii]|uniref:Trehalose-6-phosphate synthase n=1 Tax=Rhizobium grahamii TaxID=1120045 RepID=A0A370KE11_9HYPH|nr:trehalose-6-phosphate synthase [Rhizobium grahamii]
MTGGVAAALLPVVEHSGAIWVGSSGQQGNGRHALGKGSLRTLDLPAAHYPGYYEGFANSTLWPALHSRTDLMCSTPVDYDSYCKVNAFMALSLLEFREGNAFWVHDYHFLVLGAKLRELGIDRPIGFFLHTPWPVRAVIQAVPNHRQLISAMLAYDLIGFQTDQHRQNFLSCIGPDFGLVTEDHVVTSLYGQTRCQVFPIGIDADRFAQYAAESISLPHVSRMTRGLNGEKLAIGVDRLDYTKGLENRIRALAAVWAKHPRSLSLLQIATPSRDTIDTYRNLGESVRGLVNDVNRRYGSADWAPIRFLNTSQNQPVLAGLYRTARIGVVTPLCDGMNLVAKEYVAAQDPEDPGVLVLSKYAGAADELDAALLVDPQDLADMETKILMALSMPLEERQQRWKAMMKPIQAQTLQQWSSKFIGELEKSRSERIAGDFFPRDGNLDLSNRKRNGDSIDASNHWPRQLPSAGGTVRLPAEDFGHVVGTNWNHGAQTASDILIGALNRSGIVPRPLAPTDLYIHGQPYTALSTERIREPSLNNPLGIDVVLIPRLKGG